MPEGPIIQFFGQIITFAKLLSNKLVLTKLVSAKLVFQTKGRWDNMLKCLNFINPSSEEKIIFPTIILNSCRKGIYIYIYIYIYMNKKIEVCVALISSWVWRYEGGVSKEVFITIFQFKDSRLFGATCYMVKMVSNTKNKNVLPIVLKMTSTSWTIVAIYYGITYWDIEVITSVNILLNFCFCFKI